MNADVGHTSNAESPTITVPRANAVKLSSPEGSIDDHHIHVIAGITKSIFLLLTGVSVKTHAEAKRRPMSIVTEGGVGTLLRD